MNILYPYKEYLRSLSPISLVRGVWGGYGILRASQSLSLGRALSCGVFITESPL